MGYLVGGLAAVRFIVLGPHAILVALVGVAHLDSRAAVVDAAVVHDAANAPTP